MKTRTIIIVSSIFWGAIAAFNDSSLGVGLAAGVHAIVWQVHTIEVKLNKLLDYHRLIVTKEDYSD